MSVHRYQKSNVVQLQNCLFTGTCVAAQQTAALPERTAAAAAAAGSAGKPGAVCGRQNGTGSWWNCCAGSLSGTWKLERARGRRCSWLAAWRMKERWSAAPTCICRRKEQLLRPVHVCASVRVPEQGVPTCSERFPCCTGKAVRWRCCLEPESALAGWGASCSKLTTVRKRTCSCQDLYSLIVFPLFYSFEGVFTKGQSNYLYKGHKSHHIFL